MRDNIIWLQKKRSLSDRTINYAISQLRFFTIYVLHKPCDVSQLPLRRFDEYLPYVPDKKTVLIFIDTISDLKVKAMACLLYSSGLRHCEVRSLRYRDIDRTHMRIYIEHSKNRSSRYAPLSSNALAILTDYWFRYGRPTGYLFPSRNKKLRGSPVSHTFLPFQLRKHEDELGWDHRLSCHTFRHAYGTHLYEEGADLITIKSYLGHKSLNSTTIYVHLAPNGLRKSASPFDTPAGGDSHD